MMMMMMMMMFDVLLCSLMLVLLLFQLCQPLNFVILKLNLPPLTG